MEIQVVQFLEKLIGQGPDAQSATLYTFSCLAQVWAAMLGFGGFAIRDRWKDLDQSLDARFQLIVGRLQPIAAILQTETMAYNPRIFLNRDWMAQYLRTNRGFKVPFHWNPTLSKDKPYAVAHFGEEHADVTISIRDVDRRVLEVAIYFQDFDQVLTQANKLRRKIGRFILGGLFILCVSLFTTAAAHFVSKSPALIFGMTLILTLATFTLCWPLVGLFQTEPISDAPPDILEGAVEAVLPSQPGK